VVAVVVVTWLMAVHLRVVLAAVERVVVLLAIHQVTALRELLIRAVVAAELAA
jgi:hypothetical protein